MSVEVLKGKESLLPKDKKFKQISSNIKKITTQIKNLASNATEKRVDTFNNSVKSFVKQWETLSQNYLTLQEEQIFVDFASTLLTQSNLAYINRAKLSKLTDQHWRNMLAVAREEGPVEIVEAVKNAKIPEKAIEQELETKEVELPDTHEPSSGGEKEGDVSIDFISELKEIYSLHELENFNEEEIKESIDELIAYAETVEDEEEFASVIYLIDEIEEYLARKDSNENIQETTEEEEVAGEEITEVTPVNESTEEQVDEINNEDTEQIIPNQEGSETAIESEPDEDQVSETQEAENNSQNQQESSSAAESTREEPRTERASEVEKVTQQTITKEWNKMRLDASRLRLSRYKESQEANEKMVTALHPFLATLHNYDSASISKRVDKFGYFINSFKGTNRLTKNGRTAIKNEILRYHEIILKAPLTDHLFKVKNELARLYKIIDIELPVRSNPFRREVDVLAQNRLSDIFIGESESFEGIDTYLESIYKIQVDNNRPSGRYEVLTGMDGNERRVDKAKKNEDKRKFYVADMVREYFKEERMNAAKRVIALHETMPQGRSRFTREEIVEARNIISDVTEVAKLRGMQSELEMAARIYTNPSLKDSFKTTLTTMVVPPHSSADSQHKEDIISMDVVNIDMLDEVTKKALSDVYKLSSFIAMEKYKPLGYEFKGYAQDKTGLVASTPEVKQVMDTLFNLRDQIELVAQELYAEIGNYSESLKQKNPQIIRSESAIKDWDISISPKLDSLFAKEEALQRQVAAVTKNFFDSTGAVIEFTGVQIKSSKHGMEKHARRHNNACIVYNKELTEMNFMEGLGGPYESIIKQANNNLNTAFKKAFNKDN